MIKTRLAPSPTGKLHIGTARTALFNFLFAQKNRGKFILRIEDTDLDRSRPEFEKDILEGLKWLGIEWDEPKSGVYRQSQRLDLYQQFFTQLKKEGLVYECFCTPKELEKEREEMRKAGLLPRYSGRCKGLSEDEKQKMRKKRQPAWRLDVEKVVEKRGLPEVLVFNDLIRGEIKKDVKEIGDFVAVKSDQMPVFFFAGVVDDYLMKITHVIRGEDHITNTFSQLLLYKALSIKPPQFAHIPLILEKDRSKMSKRRGGSQVFDLRQKGYLPQAVVNFLALLGWSPKDDSEFLSLEELKQRFDLKGIKKGGSIFDREKLDYLAGLWIRHFKPQRLVEFFLEWLEWRSKNLGEDSLFLSVDRGQLLKIISIFQTRSVVLEDFLQAEYIFKMSDYPRELLIFKRSDLDKTKKGLENSLKAIKNYQGAWQIEKIKEVLVGVVEKSGLSNGDVFWPVRVALSGQSGSPSPQELMWVLGKKESLKRLRKALEKLSS